jgi:class 3 adenylate cyclase
MAALPAGTVTFLFSDIEGSTRLLQDLGNAAYGQALADHHRLLQAAFQDNGGEKRESQGDGLFFTFPSAKAALLAAVVAQRAVQAHAWPGG